MIAAGLSRSVSCTRASPRPRERDHARDGPEHADDHQRDDRDREPLARRQPTAAAHRRCTSSAATSSSSGPPLSSSARSTSVVTSPGGAGLERAADHRLQALAAEPRRADARAALDQPVGVEQQRPVGRAADGRPRPTARPRRRRAAGRPCPARAGTIARSAISSGGGWPASRIRAERRSGAIVTMHSVVNIHAKWRSTSWTTCSVGSTSSTPRPPSISVRHAIRRQTPSAAASGPWPETSPITAWTVPSGVLHRVVEVAAEQRAPAARAVVRGQLQGRDR